MKYLFIFAFMSIIGWILEVLYRSFISKKFINPGLMLGCSLPVYGVGGIILNLLVDIKIVNNIYFNYFILSLIAMVLLTLIEYVGGVLLEKIFKIKLWDYSTYKYNLKGLICLRMSIIWGIASLIYFVLLNNFLNEITLFFLSFEYANFLLGIYVGLFSFDLYFSMKLLNQIKKYSQKQKRIINFEMLKMQARDEFANIFALKKIFYLLYPYKNIYEFILTK